MKFVVLLIIAIVYFCAWFYCFKKKYSWARSILVIPSVMLSSGLILFAIVAIILQVYPVFTFYGAYMSYNSPYVSKFKYAEFTAIGKQRYRLFDYSKEDPESEKLDKLEKEQRAIYDEAMQLIPIDDGERDIWKYELEVFPHTGALDLTRKGKISSINKKYFINANTFVSEEMHLKYAKENRSGGWDYFTNKEYFVNKYLEQDLILFEEMSKDKKTASDYMKKLRRYELANSSTIWYFSKIFDGRFFDVKDKDKTRNLGNLFIDYYANLTKQMDSEYILLRNPLVLVEIPKYGKYLRGDKIEKLENYSSIACNSKRLSYIYLFFSTEYKGYELIETGWGKENSVLSDVDSFGYRQNRNAFLSSLHARHKEYNKDKSLSKRMYECGLNPPKVKLKPLAIKKLN